jgi:hypothetical protein
MLETSAAGGKTKMTRSMIMRASLASLALALAGCGNDQPNGANTVAAAPDTLPAGNYEVQAKVTSIRSTDGKTPLARVKVGDVLTSRGCVDDKGTPAPVLFAADGDQCLANNGYYRGGRVNMTLDCTRKGVAGKIMVNVDGRTTADGLSGSATTTSFIDGPGDYELRTDLTAKRTGACSAGPPAGGRKA